MAFFYSERNKNLLLHVIKDFLVIKHKLSVQINRDFLEIKQGSKTVVFNKNQLDKFAEFIHGLLYSFRKNKAKKSIKQLERAGQCVISKNGISVFRPENALDAAVLGKHTTFCISQFGTPYYSTYRYQNRATVYFIFDDNRSPDDPLQTVVYMIDQYGDIELTDLENTTGIISHPYNKKQRDNYTRDYLYYLKKHDIDPEKYLTYVPLTPYEQKILETYNKEVDLATFKSLSADDIKTYLSLGHELTPEQSSYLIDQSHLWYRKDMQDVLEIYLITGYPLDEKSFNKLLALRKPGLITRYLKQRVEANNEDDGYQSYIRFYEFEAMDESLRSQIEINDKFIKELIHHGQENTALELLLRDQFSYTNIDDALHNFSDESIIKLIDFWDEECEPYFFLRELKGRPLRYYIENKMPKGQKHPILPEFSNISETYSHDELLELLKTKLYVLIRDMFDLLCAFNMLGTKFVVEQIMLPKSSMVKLNLEILMPKLMYKGNKVKLSRQEKIEFVLLIAMYRSWKKDIIKYAGWNEKKIKEIKKKAAKYTFTPPYQRIIDMNCL